MRSQDLPAVLGSLLQGRVVFLGIGSEWRRDDQAGAFLARSLPCGPRFFPIEAGDVPEAFTGPVKEYGPDVILIADAVNFGSEPGDIALFDAEEVKLKRFNTHHPSLRTLIDYLRAETAAKVAIIGIQPGDVGWGQELTPAVHESVCLLRALISELLGKTSDEGATT